MIYDLIIIGAGAAGLFAGASLPFPLNGLILEKKAAPGRKLLMSGSGQCNLTHGGSIKDFISRYGENGGQIRQLLYRFNNLSMVDFLERRDVPVFEREDGKIFPKSLKAQDVLDVLKRSSMENGLKFVYSSPVDSISHRNGVYTLLCGDRSYESKKLIIATGGCSYPATGSDGGFFRILREMGFEIKPLSPALVPVYVEQYPYEALSGISFPDAEVRIGSATSGDSAKNRDALLLTHAFFSGPAVLNLSRHAHPGDTIVFNYYPGKPEEVIYKELARMVHSSGKQILTVLYEYFRGNSQAGPELPKRFLEATVRRAGADASEKSSGISSVQLRSAVGFITRDSYRIRRLGGYESAMVTAGGVALSEIDTKTMESLRYKNLYFAGEILDVDGDTGGYNLQFAFSSGCLAARSACGNS